MKYLDSWTKLPQSVQEKVFANLQEGVVFIEADGRIGFINDAAARLLNRSLQELRNRLIKDVLTGLPHLQDIQTLPPQEALTGKATPIQPGNSASILEYRLFPIDGAFLLFLEKANDHFASLSRLFHSGLLGLFWGTSQGEIQGANEAFLNLLGASLEDLSTGKLNWRHITPPEQAFLDDLAMAELQRQGIFWPYERQFVRRDGQPIDILMGGVEDGAGSFFAFMLDISAKKQAERALLEGERRFRAMADTSPMLIALVNEAQEVSYLNKRAVEYLGSSSEEVLKTGWFPYIHPDDLPHIQATLQEAYEKQGYFQYECRLRRADGIYRWVHGDGGPVLLDGKLIGFLGSAIDIHERKMSEEALAAYARRLEQSHKELEHFATIASHDLQEPLRKIAFFSDHLHSVLQNLNNAQALDDLERIQHAVRRMQQLIQDLLDLSRITRRGGPFQPTDLSLVLREVLSELSHKIKGTEAQIQIDNLPTLNCDTSQIRQMFFQLLDNALSFHRPGIPPVIQISARSAQAGYEITISDNGRGFKPEYADKIFDTFVRLQHEKEHPGTGIGLSLVRRIAERHGGSVKATSTPGQGAVFTVYLPASPKENR